MARTLVLLLLLLVSSASAQDAEEELADCTDPLQFLTPCQDVGLSGAKPSSDCCGSFNITKRYWPKCLCSFLKETTDKSSVYYTDYHVQLLKAMRVCGVPHGASDCPAILGLAPNSAASKVFEVQDTQAENASSSSNATVGSPSLPYATTTSKGATSIGIYMLGTMVSLIGAAAWILA